MARIAAFLDGTWNSAHELQLAREVARRKGRALPDETDTNIVMLFEACDETQPQVHKRYFSGVGALKEQVAAKRRRKESNFTASPDLLHGGAFGYGIGEQIRKAYTYLSDTYQPGDHIYLFGFSRGAYAARSLAGFADMVGLLLQGRGDLVEQAFWLYQQSYPGRESPLRNFLREVTGKPDWRESEGQPHELPIYFIGVFDTVAALGLPQLLYLDRVTRPFNAYHRVELPLNVTHARHALALHELRGSFRPWLWHRCIAQRQSLKQTLFRGAHADVGGGYRQAHWSNHALRWMRREIETLDDPLPLRPYIPNPPEPAAVPAPAIHCESIRKRWRLAGTYNRIAEFQASIEPLTIHQSAMQPDFSHHPDLGKTASLEVQAVQAWLPYAQYRTGWAIV